LEVVSIINGRMKWRGVVYRKWLLQHHYLLFIFRQCQHQLLSLLQLLWLLSRKVVRLVEEKCKIGLCNSSDGFRS
jgi:hypothetical protein